MSGKTKIEWTDASWNPIRGCSRVSEGCRNCYAERVAARFSGSGKPYEGLAVMKSDGPHWTGKVELVREHLEDPLHWRKPRRIFVNSMSDLFHENCDPEWIGAIFRVMLLARQHTFQILTKRPEQMRKWFREWYAGQLPSKNVWLGVSVEDQKTADERIPLLLETPAAVRWVSYEPALGPVDFTPFFDPVGSYCCGGEPEFCHCLDQWPCDEHGNYLSPNWIVCGGESGPGARPMHPDWARSARDQCQAAGVPFFFKQWGEWAPTKAKPKIGQYTGGGIFFRPDGTYGSQGDWWAKTAAAMDNLGKKSAGRLLDGREWNEFPAPHPTFAKATAGKAARQKKAVPV
jgi:protein gp37